MKNKTLHRYIGSLVAGAVALFASVHVASATQVNVQLTSVEDPASPPDGNYWNVFEFDKGGDAQSVSDALDIDGISTGISVSSVGEYEGWDSYCAETGGGTITFQIDLPCGTFDITPGFGVGSSTATITGDSLTGITGPTTVYLSFLNNGYAVTTASSIVINEY